MRLDKFTEPQRATLVLCHPNANGTGCAARMSVVPATCYNEGALKVLLARQGSNSSFDWDDALEVNLDFDDVSKMLEVLRGMTESINEEKGIYAKAATLCAIFKFRHVVEPVNGYCMEIHSSDDNVKSQAVMFLSPSEAMGLSIAVENSMSAIAFGIWRW